MVSISVTRLLQAGVLDPELAALCWLLLEAGLPLVVIGAVPRSTRLHVASALAAFRGRPSPTVVDLDLDRTGERDRGASSRRAAARQALALTSSAASLGELLERLAGPPLGLTDDETRRLSLVLVLAEATGPGPGGSAAGVPGEDRPSGGHDASSAGLDRLRVAAAHYLRPVERDGQGHLQRRPPAVLATWDRADDRFEHFAWGIVPELAARVGREAADFEARQAERAAMLQALVRDGHTEPRDLERALLALRTPGAGASTMPA